MTDDDLNTRSVRHVDQLGLPKTKPSMMLAHHLMKARNLYAIYMESALNKAGIKSSDGDVLMAIHVRDDTITTPRDLADQFALTSAAITKRLDALERVGMLRRLRHESDRRSVTLELTPEGAKAAVLVIKIKAEALNDLTADAFENAELDALNNGLENLIRALRDRVI